LGLGDPELPPEGLEPLGEEPALDEPGVTGVLDPDPALAVEVGGAKAELKEVSPSKMAHSFEMVVSAAGPSAEGVGQVEVMHAAKTPWKVWKVLLGQMHARSAKSAHPTEGSVAALLKQVTLHWPAAGSTPAGRVADGAWATAKDAAERRARTVNCIVLVQAYAARGSRVL